VRGRISYDDFKSLMDGAGGFVYAGWCGDPACEAAIKGETKATIRVLPDVLPATGTRACARTDASAFPSGRRSPIG